MKHFLNFLISFSLIIILASCAGESKPAGEQAATQEQAPNQTIVTEQQTQSADPQTQSLPGTQPQTSPATQRPQTTITQPTQNQTASGSNSGDIIIGNEIGNDLGDFVNYSPDSTLLNLSSLRGKLVMVVLWNSLCHHCVIDNEKLRETYNNFHDKKFTHGNGFEIYAIALDKERETWIQALNEKKYPWKYNVYVIDSWKDRDVRFFGIKNLPGYFLIDRDGIVVNKMFTADELNGILQGYLVN
jgi:thiol-disulfide isomerase/thioredoxin